MSNLSNNEDENDRNDRDHEESLIPSNLLEDDYTMDNAVNIDEINNLPRTSAVSSSTSSSSLGLLNNDILDSSFNPNSLTEPLNPDQVNNDLNQSTFNIPNPHTGPGISSIYLEYRNNIINNLLNRGRIRLHNSRIIDTESSRSQRTDSNVEDNLMRNIHGGGDYDIGGVPVSWISDVENNSGSENSWGRRLDELRNIQIFNSLTPAAIENAVSSGILSRDADEDWLHYLNVLRDYVLYASPPRWERINIDNNYVNNENNAQQPDHLEQRTNGFTISATTPSNWPITWNPASMFDDFDEEIEEEYENQLPQEEDNDRQNLNNRNNNPDPFLPWRIGINNLPVISASADVLFRLAQSLQVDGSCLNSVNLPGNFNADNPVENINSGDITSVLADIDQSLIPTQDIYQPNQSSENIPLISQETDEQEANLSANNELNELGETGDVFRNLTDLIQSIESIMVNVNADHGTNDNELSLLREEPELEETHNNLTSSEAESYPDEKIN